MGITKKHKDHPQKTQRKFVDGLFVLFCGYILIGRIIGTFFL